MTERAQNADFRRKPQIFADSPLLVEIPAFGGRRKPQKTADFRRKPKIFAGNRRKPQIGLRHLSCVTFSSALNNVFNYSAQISSGNAEGCRIHGSDPSVYLDDGDTDSSPCFTVFKLFYVTLTNRGYCVLALSFC